MPRRLAHLVFVHLLLVGAASGLAAFGVARLLAPERVEVPAPLRAGVERLAATLPDTEDAAFPAALAALGDELGLHLCVFEPEAARASAPAPSSRWVETAGFMRTDRAAIACAWAMAAPWSGQTPRRLMARRAGSPWPGSPRSWASPWGAGSSPGG
ncbi:MAG: hypothetical protein IPI35_31925 [Deltaproteobacteria bacterium]|nr:hypothetical protein [Deltaproteobacteria bacterium]